MPNWRRRWLKHYRRWLVLSRLRCRRLATILAAAVCAVNYLVRRLPHALAGRRMSATGTADWVLRDTADPVVEGAGAIAGFIHELGVYSGEYAPDLLRLINLRDCFSPDALSPTMVAGMRHAGLITAMVKTGDECC